MLRPATMLLILTLLFPPAVYVALSASSMSPGVLICAALWMCAGIAFATPPFTVRRSDSTRMMLSAGGVMILAVHVAINSFQLGNVDFGRFGSSCAFLLLMLVGAHFAANLLLQVPAARLVKTADLGLAILILLAVASVAGVPPIGPQASAKAVVIFSEPSLFAASYLPLLMFRTAISARGRQLLLIGISLLLAMVMQNLIMIAGVLIVSALMLRRTALVLMLIAVAGGLLTLDLTYYAARLNLSSETDNISTLVLLQGWQNALLNLQETHGLGVGFQQFGVSGSIGSIAEKISTILGSYINLLDGGSTSTKLIGEFGIFGILAILLFLRIAIRCGLYIRGAQQMRPRSRDVRTIFFYAMIVSYCFELALRGSGYFTPGGLLMLSALIATRRDRSLGGREQVTAKAASAALPAPQPPMAPAVGA
jgi:hypothetical protein